MTAPRPKRHLPFVLALFALCALARADDRTSRSADLNLRSDFAAEAARYMRERVRVTGFSGAVLMAHDGRPVFREGYGLANHEFDIANTPKTKFRIGSAGKQFTAAAILLLEQRGKLKVSDTVGQYLSDWPKAWNDVALHHLLSHTGGLPPLATQALVDVSGFNRPPLPPPFRSIRDLHKPGEELQPLDFKPGEKFHYNNHGYIVLGMVIETVSGMPYSEFMRDEVFRPLGMTDTSCEEPGPILKQRAGGYARVAGTVVNAAYVDMRYAGGSGSVLSTVDDLLIWDRTLASDRLLSAAAREKLSTLVKGDYAYGWWVQTKFGRKAQWHRGNISGFVGMLARYPEERLFIVVLSNFDRTQVRAIATELAAIAFGEKYELPREHNEIKLDPATYDSYVGTYIKDGETEKKRVIARDGNRLMFQRPGGPPLFEIFPESPVQFFAKWGDYYLTFAKDDKGQVTHVLIRDEGEESKWVKSQ